MHDRGLTGPDKNTMKVPTVSCAFELVSFGDGRIVNDRTNPKFDALAPAECSGLSAAPIPDDFTRTPSGAFERTQSVRAL